MTTLDHGNDTRSRILAAAQELFAERGYAATSLADIAAVVGLTKTAIAYHFHPKDRLAAELIAPAADDLFTFLGEPFTLEGLVTFTVRHRAVIRLMMEDFGHGDEPVPGTPAEAIRTFRDEIYRRIVGPDPDDAARIRGWAVLGALEWGIVHTMDLPEERVRAHLLALLTHWI
ncbi:TetR family transcriptional regulator [Nonomuraea sp. NPDC050328]|uniref:TetR family transcriptional regulator n=1 Tax=Nonomuraea sp. NPDC050328 TaxID=3364361 RepID=UPI0037BB8D1D